MLCVVSPVDQTLSIAEDEVSTTEPPAQKVVAPPGVIVGAAGAPGSLKLTLIILEVQPLLSKVKLYVPAVKPLKT